VQQAIHPNQKMITSQHNDRLKQLRRLHRRRERDRLSQFVAEGEDLIEAADAAGWTAVEGFRAPDWRPARGTEFTDVAPKALAAVCALQSGARAIGVYEQRFQPQPVGRLCLYLHRLADPGNVGACLRSAAAFGASCVALGEPCADPYSPKAVRASMGAIFGVSLTKVGSVAQLPGVKVALVAREGVPIGDLELGDRPVSLLVGAERDGLPGEIVQACDVVAHIPIATESLNAAIAASVALYELRRDSIRVRAS
jgi:RNA methyltransferase, TrmH family